MKNYKINIIFYNTSTHFIVLYPNHTQRHLKNPYKAHKYRLCRDLPFHSNSTKPNQFCLEIILCRIRGAFDYLMYPYYPAYMG